MLEEAGRGDDYLEIGLGGSWQWNPLDDPLLDSYSLAYTVSSLINRNYPGTSAHVVLMGPRDPDTTLSEAVENVAKALEG